MTFPRPTVNNKAARWSRESNSSAQSSKQGAINEDILDDTSGHIQVGVKGFYEKYFKSKSWSTAAERVVRAVDPKFLNGRWTDCPKFQSRSDFLDWLWGLQSAFFTGFENEYIRMEQPHCEPNQVLVLSQYSKSEKEPSWADVKVIGEFCEDMQGMYLEGLLHLCEHARKVFSSQPTRRFLHGFYVCDAMMELWVFDRSGLYSSESFDISKSPERFLTVIAGYVLMGDEELGMSTLITEDSVGKYILCGGDDNTNAERIYLENEPIGFRRKRHMVSDGLACYRARRSVSEQWEFVVKFKWRSAAQLQEAKVLNLAKERRVWGVVQLHSYQNLDNTENLREGLQFGVSREFLPAECLSWVTIQSKSRSTNKWEGGPSQGSDEAIWNRISGDGGLGGVLNYTVRTRALPRGKTCKNLEPFETRTLSYMIISPIGRPLHTFVNIPELLEAFRDCLKGHRSLYQDGRILHRDISMGNMLITPAGKAGEPKGMLIDFDLAIDIEKGPCDERKLVGTLQFLSIGILIGRQWYRALNTYRDDLESFFYVFLWVIICNRSKHPPEASRLLEWTVGTPFQLGQKKMKDMHQSEFERIVSEFPENLKSLHCLAENLRQILFPIRGGELWTGVDGTADGIDGLYDSMINAFNMAIVSAQRL